MFLTIFITLLNAFVHGAYAQQSPPKNLDVGKITQDFFLSNYDECTKEFSHCDRLFELTFAKPATTLELKLKSAAVFGTVYEFSKICGETDKATCDLIGAIFDDKRDSCQKFGQGNGLLCSDVRSFRLQNCAGIQDQYLKSVCEKKLSPACRSDVVCSIAWSYTFKEEAEILKSAPPEILKTFVKLYDEDKKMLSEQIKIAEGNPVQPPASVILAPSFPAPVKKVDFVVPNKRPTAKAVTGRPDFKMLSSVKSFTPGIRQLVHPWARGEGLTAADWDGDGFMDIFTVDGNDIFFFKNVNGSEFKKFVINLASFNLKGGLIDISIADIDGQGTPAILAQSYPSTLYVLRWNKEKSYFDVETVTLPNSSRSHAFVKFKSGIGIVFAGWNGISSPYTPASGDYLARIKSRKWTFEKIDSPLTPTLGMSVIEQNNKQQVLVINKDLEGGVQLFNVVDDALVKIPHNEKFNFYPHSAAYLYTSKKEDLWVTSGLSFEEAQNKKRKVMAPPKTTDDCKNWTGNDKAYCAIRLGKKTTNGWGSLCKLYKDADIAKVCLAQNEVVTTISGIKEMDPTHYEAQVFRNLNAPAIDDNASAIVASLGQIWHMSPLQSPAMEGFIMSEAMTKPVERKLWWVGYTKSGFQKVDLSNTLGLSAPYDATQFALVDLNRDGQLDMVFKSGTEMVFLKGETGGDSSLKSNLQMGHQSRTLISIPTNPKE